MKKLAFAIAAFGLAIFSVHARNQLPRKTRARGKPAGASGAPRPTK